MSYYPSHGSYTQPVVYPSSRHSHGSHGRSRHHRHSSDNYYPEPVAYAPSRSSGRRHRRHHGHHDAPPVTVVPTAPIVVQPNHASSHGHHHRHHHGSGYHSRSIGERVRHFFGLAPRANYRYKSNKSSWGFMGYSPRPRYYDARTGGEVDKHGRPVYRV